jgi:hypothetical protein
MELHQVRYFLAVCKEKSFTRAAKHCGVPQPSLSDAIKRLEQELGGQLFHRSRVNCLLSELGQEVWPHLAKLDQCARDARRQAVRFLTAPQGSAAALEQMPSSSKPLIHGSLGFIWVTQNNRRKGHKMRRPIYFIGACALAAVATFVWSQNALVSSGANSALATFLPHRSLLAAAAATTPAMSPTEMMNNYNRPLPVEQWDAF